MSSTDAGDDGKLGLAGGATVGAALGLLFDGVGQSIVVDVVAGMFVALALEQRAEADSTDAEN